jgi:hypothetical protein
MRTPLVSALCGIALLAVAPSATASPGEDAHLEMVRHTDVASSEAAIPCPAGERALSGGVFTESGNSPLAIGADGPLDETGATANTGDGDVPRYWFTEAATGGAPDNFTHYALCSASSDAILRAKALTIPAYLICPSGCSLDTPGRSGDLASCPDGTRAISGGFGSSENAMGYRRAIFNQPLAAGANLAGTTTGAVAQGWYLFGENDNPDADAHMKVFAVCSASAQATVQATSFVTGSAAQSSAVCPPTSRSTGGGFGATTNSSFGDWVSSAPATSGGSPATSESDVPRGWFGRVDATSFSATYRVYSLCEPGPPLPAPAGAPAAAPRKCKKKHAKKRAAETRKKCHHKRRKHS